jgi:transposase
MLSSKIGGSSMKVDWKDPADAERLRDLMNGESDAKQRDRYRVVLIAGEGLGEQRELERQAIAQTVNRARQFVDQWVGRYRRDGISALRPKRQPGAKSKLTLQQEQELCVMLDAGPDPAEGLAAFNGPILRERIQQRFGKLYSLAGVYALLHRLGYNDLMPRTTHPDTDPAELDAFKKKSSPSVWLSSKKPIPTNAC